MKMLQGNIIKTIEAEDIKNYIGQRINIHGSIYKIRKMSGFSFVLLRTKRSIVQCVYSEEFSQLDVNLLKESLKIKLDDEKITDLLVCKVSDVKIIRMGIKNA